MASVKLERVTKILSSGVPAVKDFSIEASDGDFIVFTGPSGSGKSALIRMIAGLDDVTYGEIFIDGVRVNNIETKDRSVAMVFKNHMLYPDKTVYENLSIGLKMMGKEEEEIKTVIARYAPIFGLCDIMDCYPDELDEMQKHKTVIARAVVKEPKVLLMDDPNFCLDRKQIMELRDMLRTVHEDYNTVIFYMTGDLQEALEIGNRVVILYDGVIQQIATPEEIRKCPANQFVKDYVL